MLVAPNDHSYLSAVKFQFGIFTHAFYSQHQANWILADDFLTRNSDTFVKKNAFNSLISLQNSLS